MLGLLKTDQKENSMTGIREPGPGQYSFDGQQVPLTVPPAPTPHKPILERRRAFGSVPGYAGRVSLVKPGDVSLAEIMANVDDAEHINPTYLQMALYTDQEQSYNGLALNPLEYSTVLLDANSFKNRSLARIERTAAFNESSEIRKGEMRITVPLHAFEKLAKRHIGLITGLDNERVLLRDMSLQARSPGFAHIKEADLRMRASSVITTTFENIVEVVSRAKHWTPEEKVRAKLAMMERLSSGPQRDRVGYWQVLLCVGENYAGRRKTVMTASANRVDTQIRLLENELAVYCERYGIIR